MRSKTTVCLELDEVKNRQYAVYVIGQKYDFVRYLAKRMATVLLLVRWTGEFRKRKRSCERR